MILIVFPKDMSLWMEVVAGYHLKARQLQNACAKKKAKCFSHSAFINPGDNLRIIFLFYCAIRLYFSGCSIILNDRSTSRLGQYKCSLCHNSTSLICCTVVFLNQGNCSNGKKYSLSLKKIQKPCSDIFVISGFKMLLPRFNDFIFVFLNYLL